jgi:hypothetical protein
VQMAVAGAGVAARVWAVCLMSARLEGFYLKR